MEKILWKGVIISLMLTFVVSQALVLFRGNTLQDNSVSTAVTLRNPKSSQLAQSFTGIGIPGQSNYLSVVSPVFNESSSTVDSTQLHTYMYKLLTAVDPCTLNQLGSQGWQAVQFGGTLITSLGRDEKCGNLFNGSALDWVLFQRDIPPETTIAQ